MEGFLFLTSIIFLSSGLYFHRRLKSFHSNTSKGILFTASAIYALMGILMYFNDDTPIRVWRYTDWFITVPLLIIELYAFIDENRKSGKELLLIVLSSLVMLLFGLLGEVDCISKYWANGVGFVFGVLIFYILFKKYDKKHYEFLKAIGVLWLFYPIVYFVNDSVLTLLLFSVVDLLAKTGSAFYILYQEKYLKP